MNKCLNCEKETKNPKYCSMDCQFLYRNREKGIQIEQGLVKDPRTLKRWLKEHYGWKCSICGIEEWREQEAPLILDHIDGNSENCYPSNIRFVCPNCDALLPTYKARNKGNGRYSRRQRYAEGKSF